MTFSWAAPDYIPIFQERMDRLAKIRADPSLLATLRSHYRNAPADFINDWASTYDPRLVKAGLPAIVPFVLFPKQREFLDWLYHQWRNDGKALAEKSRDAGLSWLCISFGCWMCLFYDGVSVGYGSSLERNVDDSEDPDALFWKARMFMRGLPPEFRNGWNEKTDTRYMKISFRATGSTMTGSAGDDIGRGGRKTVFFVDESASLPRPMLIEASLSQTTPCRIDVSTPRGMGNPFAQKRHSGLVPVFTFGWRDDPRKDQAWYDKQVQDLDPVTVAQEIDLSYTASVEGVLIPSSWVQASIDAHLKLGIAPTGERSGALDVADEGRDLNAFCGAHGILVEHISEWSGKGDDIYGTVLKAFEIANGLNYGSFKFDSDGLGAGVRGDARVINESRAAETRVEVTPFRGSAEVLRPESEDVKGRKNKDYFANRKAQAWFALRKRFQTTFRAVTEGVPYDPDDLIALDGTMPLVTKLAMELSQPTYKLNAAGKILIEKAPDGARSPNLADAVMIRYASRAQIPMIISDDALKGI